MVKIQEYGIGAHVFTLRGDGKYYSATVLKFLFADDPENQSGIDKYLIDVFFPDGRLTQWEAACNVYAFK